MFPIRRALTPVVVGVLPAATALILLAATAVAGPAAAATNRAPFGHLGIARVVLGAGQVVGWAIDPDTTGPTSVTVTVDGHSVVTAVARDPRPKLRLAYPAFGGHHGFDLSVPVADGTHQVCVKALDTAKGPATSLGCATLTAAHEPVGAITDVARTARGVAVTGWALDPDSTDPVTVTVQADGTTAATTSAAAAADIPAPWQANGTAHGFTVRVATDPSAHRICLSAANLGPGADAALGCVDVPAATPPAAPTGLAATASTNGATLTWQAPAATGGTPLTGYAVTLSPGTKTSAAATATSLTLTGLAAGTAYEVSVAAVNAVGTGTAATVSFTTPAPAPVIAPQTTPAPVSTSHYLRNLTGDVTHDTALMRAMGAQDAGYNPSGHRYLVLQDIGAQAAGGVILSATIKDIGYADLVAALKAYVDGYASSQKANAPMTMAIGTNNDGSVGSAQGRIWADTVVDPVRAYAAKYPSIRIAGANDMEPGFYAGPAATRSWLSGYLGATSAVFFFNGSADGCPTSASSSRCNNGWTTADLHWLAGGAAPTQVRVLPQIYNTTMPLQWRAISIAGTDRLSFGGPLTEWTACAQAGGCGSMTNVSAWQTLFDDLRADPRTSIAAMPFGTDLRIN